MYFVLYGGTLQGQVSFQPKKAVSDQKGIIYRKEISGFAQWNTYGYGIGFRKGKIKTYYKTTFTHFEFDYLKDSRESSQNKNIQLIGTISKSFKYGKQNYFYSLKIGKGVKKHLTEKAKRRGVILGYEWETGGTLGLLRPYYLDLVYREETNASLYTIKSEKYTNTNTTKFLDYNSILGRSNSGYGWGEIKVVPGIHGKLGMMVTTGIFDKTLKSLYLGITSDLYIRKIPIMVETEQIKNKPYFINFYVSMEFGQRQN